MSARIEQCLLSHAIEHKLFQALEKNKITEEYFFDTQYRDLYLLIRDYFRRNGDTPDPATLHGMRPNLNLQWGIQDNIDGMCEELRRVKIRADAIRLSEHIRAAADSTNPREALEILRNASITLANEHSRSRDLLITEAGEVLAGRYQQSEAAGGVIGIPWPWECLSAETRGIQKGHFMLIYGRPKNGKTWVAVITAAHALKDCNQRVLFYSMEMSEAEILERVLCAAANVDYDSYFKGQLRQTDPVGFDRYWAMGEWLQQNRDRSIREGHQYVPDILATCDSDEGGGGITSLRAKIREFNPTLVIVDSMYLMNDDRGKGKNAKWDAMTNISRDLKKTAQQFNVPIIGVTQGNRLADKDYSKADLREIGYADAPGQDADLILRVDKKQTDTGETEVYISVVGHRHGSGKLNCFSIFFHPCVNTTFHRLINSDDSQTPAQQQPQSSSGGRPTPTFHPNMWNGPGAR